MPFYKVWIKFPELNEYLHVVLISLQRVLVWLQFQLACLCSIHLMKSDFISIWLLHCIWVNSCELSSYDLTNVVSCCTVPLTDIVDQQHPTRLVIFALKRPSTDIARFVFYDATIAFAREVPHIPTHLLRSPVQGRADFIEGVIRHEVRIESSLTFMIVVSKNLCIIIPFQFKRCM